MKSPFNLKAIHEKAVCICELLQEAERRRDHYAKTLAAYQADKIKNNGWSREPQFYFMNEGDLMKNVVVSEMVYQRIIKYYFNHLKQLA